MRQGQQNRRGRGRNRKSQNPLTRSFESAGPDVKIRGTPSHIAEKYMTLARDALSSGDPVLAENYMQHAEHYNRIIMSFREQQISQGGDPFAGGQIARGPGMPGDPLDGDEFDEDGDEFGEGRAQGQPDIGAMPQPSGNPGPGPGPRNYEGQSQRYDNRQHNQHRRDNHRPHNNQRHDRGDNNRFDRNNDRGDRYMGNDNRGNDNRSERHERGDRQDYRGGDRPERQFDRQPNGNGDYRGPPRDDRGPREDRGPRDDRGPREDRGPRDDRVMRDDRGPREDRPVREERAPREDRSVQPPMPDLNGNAAEHQPVVAVPVAAAPAPAPRRRERFQPPADAVPAGATPVHQQPEFLRRPVRRPRAEPAAEEAAPAPTPRTEETE